MTTSRRSARTLAWKLLPLAAIGMLAIGCGGEPPLRVLAASSLSEVMPALIERYEAEHPGVEIELRLGGSQALATQIEEGAPADLFVSANAAQARRLVDGGLLTASAPIAANRLVVAVAEGSELHTVEQLAEDGVRIAVGAPGVPVGALTALALDALPARIAAGIRANVVTEDTNVRFALSRVELGEADAAFVYHTDLVAVPGMRAIELPPGLGVPGAEYVAGLVSGGDPRAVQLLEFLRGAEAGAVLAEAGFTPAGAP